MTRPELIVQDFQGHHNKHGAATRARLIRGGSWKRQRIVVILPADQMMSSKAALSHWNLIFPPNQAVARILALGLEVGDAYSTAIEQVLAHPEMSKWEYILSIESDNLPPPDGVLKLLESMEEHRELAAISGLYWTRGEGGQPQVWGDPKDVPLNFRPQIPIPNSVQECNGIGMGMALWRLNMFKDPQLRRPWFQTAAGREGVGTQDLFFASDARKYGYRFAVDTRVAVGHIDAEGMVW